MNTELASISIPRILAQCYKALFFSEKDPNLAPTQHTGCKTYQTARALKYAVSELTSLISGTFSTRHILQPQKQDHENSSPDLGIVNIAISS